MKKLLLAFLLSLLLLLSLPAGAAGQTTAFSLSYANGTAGGVVEVFLSCDENPGFSGAALNIGFDPDVLQYDGCTTADGFDPDIFSAVETEGQLRIAFTDRQADFYMTGRLLTVRFRIVGETEGDSLSRLTLSAPAGAVADVRYRSAECRVTDGGVYIGSSAIHLLPGSAYVLDRERGYVTGIAPQTAPEAFLQQFTGSPSFSPSGSRYVFTGSAVAAGSELYRDYERRPQRRRDPYGQRLPARQTRHRARRRADRNPDPRRRRVGRREADGQRLPAAQKKRAGAGTSRHL